jgi:hypothetical protein
MSRRKLEPKQEVLIVYNSEIGFTEDKATFLRYERTPIGETIVNIPIFECQDNELSGLECFWILPDDIRSPENLQRFQYDLISVQLKALEVAHELGYEVPLKIKDKRLKEMAQQSQDNLESLIQKIGFDPRDESWIEQELAETERESNWFRFERDNALMFMEKWDDMTEVFNQRFADTISVEQAKNMSKKRMRFILGAYHTRMTGNQSKTEWKKAALDFEKKHRERENRMLTWTMAHKERFPLVKVKKPIKFFPGPFFAQISEKVPHMFTGTFFNSIKEGVVLRVVSYDPVQKYIRLDFTDEIRELIHGVKDEEPWMKDKSDYDMWIKPESIDDHLEFLESLD